MAVVRWGIDDPENPRNKENPGLSQQLEKERRSFVGSATKGAIRTNSDGSIMRFKTEEESDENESETEGQESAVRTVGEMDTNLRITTPSEVEQDNEDVSAEEDHESSPDSYSYLEYASISSTEIAEAASLPQGWLYGILADRSRFWYTAERFSGPIVYELPTDVPENYVYNERIEQWEHLDELRNR